MIYPQLKEQPRFQCFILFQKPVINFKVTTFLHINDKNLISEIIIFNFKLLNTDHIAKYARGYILFFKKDI